MTATALAVAVLAACAPAPASSTSTGPGTAVSAADLATLKQSLADAAKQPRFAAPGPAFSVSGLAGRKILSIPVSSQVTTCDTISREVVDVAKSVGI